MPKPFFVLAPMEAVTDTVFRQVVLSCAKPDLMFTEFTNVEGMLSVGKAEVGKRFIYEKNEHPLIAHIWGSNPESFEKVARMANKMGFDGIDINMGCPERNIVAHGSCSGLIDNPPLAFEIIKKTKEGAGDLPVSVKTRIGLKTIKTEEWIGFLLEQNLDALTVHLRTQKEMSNVPAHWEEAYKLASLRDKISPRTIIVGNGDVMSKKQGYELSKKYKLDGIMIGRGIFHNPFVFDSTVNYELMAKKERITLLKRHIDFFEKAWTEKYPLPSQKLQKRFPPLKRFFKIYISGFDGAVELREQLMGTSTTQEARNILEKWP